MKIPNTVYWLKSIKNILFSSLVLSLLLFLSIYVHNMDKNKKQGRVLRLLNGWEGQPFLE
jgi:hypothetical protein